MISGAFLFLRFHFRRLYASQPWMLSGLLIALLALAGMALAHWHTAELLAAEAYGNALLQSRAKAVLANGDKDVRATPSAPMLPWFQGADLIAELGRIADSAAVPVDEVGYALDEGANQPYMRYRVTMTVVATYPAVRRFVRGVPATLSNVDLDAISCKRSDITVAALSCDLVFSAFFRKDGHG
ncbi:MAG: hypothetical protein JO002_17250 [Burkholderiaceae bacterium]|nr:hypothetical protein [Burkholderiaceae bacterium]